MFASDDFFCRNGVAIDLFAGLVVRTKRRALEGNSGTQTAGTRVAQDLGSHPSVGICGSITSFGVSGNGSICAQFNLAAYGKPSRRARSLRLHQMQVSV